MIVKQLVKSERAKQDLSQEALAKRCGLVKMSVWRVENGIRQKPETLRRICDGLGISLEEMGEAIKEEFIGGAS